MSGSIFFFSTAASTTAIYTLSLHDALPIYFLKGIALVLAGELGLSHAENAPPWTNALTKEAMTRDRKSTRLNSSHVSISYAVFCLKKKNHYAVAVFARCRPPRPKVTPRASS